MFLKHGGRRERRGERKKEKEQEQGGERSEGTQKRHKKGVEEAHSLNR
jgi:hypothetical protein